MPDKTVWTFSDTVVKSETGIKYTQFIATDFTKLYNLQEELVECNSELEEMIAQVQRISENIAEIIRQQEILTAKMRVHNKMGNCLLSARQLHDGMMTDDPKVWEERNGELWIEVGEGMSEDGWTKISDDDGYLLFMTTRCGSGRFTFRRHIRYDKERCQGDARRTYE